MTLAWAIGCTLAGVIAGFLIGRWYEEWLYFHYMNKGSKIYDRPDVKR